MFDKINHISIKASVITCAKSNLNKKIIHEDKTDCEEIHHACQCSYCAYYDCDVPIRNIHNEYDRPSHCTTKSHLSQFKSPEPPHNHRHHIKQSQVPKKKYKHHKSSYQSYRSYQSYIGYKNPRRRRPVNRSFTY